MEFLIQIIVILAFVGIGYFFGKRREEAHYASIRAREKETLHVPIINFGAKQSLPEAHECELFVGSTVVANDYFKSISAALRNLVGGRVVVYESLVDRARREALLRMKEDAIKWGASQILNVRFETANIAGQGQNNGMTSVEVMAYGTGIR